MDFAELNQQFDTLQKTVVALKETHEKEIKELKKGFVPSETKERIEKIEKDLDAAHEKMKALEVANNRPAGTDEEQEKAEGAKQIRRAAFEKLLRKGREWLSPEEAKALSTDSDPSGGFLVPTEMSNQIMTKVFETSPMRQLASVETISSGDWEELADWSEEDAEAPGERGTRNDTTNTEFSMLSIKPHNIAAQVILTQNMVDDAKFDVEAYLQRKAAEKFTRLENTWFVSGTGVNQARGILSYTAGDGYGLVEQVNSGTSGDFDGDDLMSFQDTLLEAFQPNASWLMRRATRTKIRKFKDGNGQYLWSIDRGLNGRVQETLLGQPLYLGSDMPAVGANALAIAYGDFKQGYLIADRIGVRVVRDVVTSPGFVKVNFSKRTGGGMRHYQAIKLLKLAV